MGGFSVKLADAVEQKVAPDVMNKVWAGVFSMGTALEQSAPGKAMKEMLTKQYHPQVEKETLGIVQQAKAAGSNMTPSEIRGMAKSQARAKVFGQNDEIIQGFVKAIERTKGKEHAQNIVDHLNTHFQEAGDTGGRKAGWSRLDKNLARGGKDNAFSINHPTVYEPVKDLERTLKTWETAAFAAKAAIPHAATQLNVLLQDGFKNYVKAVSSVITPSGYDSAKQMLLAHGAISETAMKEYEQIHAFNNGKIKNYLPGSMGAFIQRNFAMPGMDALRQWTVTMAGVSAKMSAEEAAIRFVNGDRSFEPVLRELNLDPQKILFQQGRLAPEDYQKAIYHGVNNSVFLPGEASLSRTRASQSTMTGRLVTAFHTYTTRQAGLIKNVLKRDLIERKDPIAAARTLATLGVIFPTVGNAIYELERLSRGQDWNENPAEKFKNRESKMYGADGFVDAFLQHIESLASTASFGVATSYGRGVFRAHLANQLLGPIGNTAVTFTEDAGKEIGDVIKAASGGELHSGPLKNLGRDVIQMTPMAGANTAAKHLLLPTKQEEAASRPKTAKQLKAAIKRRMKKKGTSFFDPNND